MHPRNSHPPPQKTLSLKTPTFFLSTMDPRNSHSPPQKTLSPSKLPTFFLSTMHPETTHIAHPEKYTLSLSLPLSLKSPNFLSLDNAPQKLTLPTSKNTLSLSLCLNQREPPEVLIPSYLGRILYGEGEQDRICRDKKSNKRAQVQTREREIAHHIVCAVYR
jgi:hypothetical protein